ncbi:CshA/CshB family fibrillar adhesin-related protein [Chitinophaga horti]|uniref:CshA/CshB family fibrillar adhesin-related protein n=1 Tax=Chitinophaga horti TaxID=2920382 RepID=A0ABY6J4G1_9BACT|nr:CshA/CshB family fibrillar adhesin-related protein [Chitinophaga horti]UYQ93179.1 CshA/CshB family fibrillar adhesin-related protein [Chitinophaga horti]
MTKKLLTILLLLCSQLASAQFADRGTGALRDQIWWLDWSNIALTASHSMVTPDGMTLTFSISNVTGFTPAPSGMRTWGAAMLHSLYDFSDPALMPALYSYGNNQNTNFRLNITARRNGQPVAFTVVTADAEASAPNEVTTITTNKGAWSTIDFFRNSTQTSNPAQGCGTRQVRITDTYGMVLGQVYGQMPVLATTSTDGSIALDVEYNKGGAYGGMALAFGVYSPIDRGDLPASYGFAQHRLTYQVLNSCNFNPPYPSQVPSVSLTLGSMPGDADGQQTLNDNALVADEDAISSFPAYNGSGTYSLAVPLVNTTGAAAYLAGWFDFNGDKQFTLAERAVATIATGSTSATLTWAGLPAELPAPTAADYHDFGLRLRLSSDQADAQQPAGPARDGEVEDYLVPFYIPCKFALPADKVLDLCSGETVQLNASQADAVSYRWAANNTLSDDGIGNPVASPTTNTTYQVTAQDIRGCQDAASFIVNVRPSPTINTSGDVRICAGQSAPLSASSAINAAFSWSPAVGLNDAGISNPTASPTSTTSYVVTATSANNCKSTARVNVAVTSAPVFSVSSYNQSVCVGEEVVIKASGGDAYTWRAPDKTAIGTGGELRLQAAAGGMYSVEITDQVCNISRTFDLPLSVASQPQTSVTKSNDVDCIHGSAMLQASGGLTYSWDPAPGLNTLSGDKVVVTPGQPTMYYVNVSNGGKCVKKDSVFVDFNANSELSSFPMANAFSPNNDGRNDCFGLKFWGPVLQLDFSVFNRWGELVFHTDDPLHCWDGSFKGAPQPAGTYVFVVKAKTACGNGERQGTVVLVR